MSLSPQSTPLRPDGRVKGTFTLPLWSDEPVDDPWQRAYMRPPSNVYGASVQRSFPLVDFRPFVFSTDEDDDKERSREHLRRWGFTALRHQTSLMTQEKGLEAFDSSDRMEETYYPEIQRLVMDLTGAKQVFVTNSYVRRSHDPKVNGADAAQPASANIKSGKDNFGRSDTVLSTAKRDSAIHVPSSAGVKPARQPHLDYTPLGARQAIRKWRWDIHQAAIERGVIGAEDKICEQEAVEAVHESSNDVIAREYNRQPCGPRYAAYSVWRPLKRVTCDPLAILPRKSMDQAKKVGIVEWVYNIRVPGHPDLGGDFLRNLALLRFQERSDFAEQKSGDQSGDLQWYYLSNQKPDEVVVVKFFDSAGLGGEADKAGAPYHGSPDLGEAVPGEGRESIEVRVVAFW